MNKLEPCSNKNCAGINSGIDKCIRGLVGALNEAGFETVASCCGHRNAIGTIALRNGVELLIAPDYEAARALCDYANRDIHDNHKSEVVEYWKLRAESAERERNDKELEITVLETLLSNLWPGNYKPMNIVVEELTEALRQQLNGGE